jgi:hypothetical protein
MELLDQEVLEGLGMEAWVLANELHDKVCNLASLACLVHI